MESQISKLKLQIRLILLAAIPLLFIVHYWGVVQGKESVPHIIGEETSENVKYIFIAVPTKGTVIADKDGYLATGFINLHSVRFNEDGQFELYENSLLVLTCPEHEAIIPHAGSAPKTALVSCGTEQDLVDALEYALEANK